MTSPADELKAAAAKIRAVAASATESPWEIWQDLNHQGFITIGDQAGVLTAELPEADDCNPVAHVYTGGDADYIAAMHPGVGLLLADWLDQEAKRITCASSTAGQVIVGRRALAVARAILGGQP